ncbi:MAG: Aromatic dipeptide epimerase [Candidatus Moanabacter tarae]|uniref:Dipeptide epimerase n=1 Tax=Candidatus Moanibacter tarae TaxID=2200854 RepID=A0A2Z4ACW2_9BACT|nr:MAG: Aromatic dipeptide epimerase [Candidatus Moanabacter tarae]|tara:strand:- start:16029 stop:17126 length:1098 start_codon:yes stop_codon:yes gene_type:complete
MLKDSEFSIIKVNISEIDIPISEAFTISQGEVRVARNIIIILFLKKGVYGYGEIAPFQELTGEARDDCLAAAQETSKFLTGLNVTNFRGIGNALRNRLPEFPSVRCGFETAIADALSRGTGIPLWALWGGADVRKYETDVTIPIRDINDSIDIVGTWCVKGFRRIKVKVGIDVERDILLMEALSKQFPGLKVIIDANQGYSVSQAIAFADVLEQTNLRIEVFEQPVDYRDLEGLKELREKLIFPIAADESVLSLTDAKKIIEMNAADIINLKITKSGLIETIEIASLCKAFGIGLMIGGMIETRIAMGCSFSLVLGLGGISILDLDTPLLMAEDPFASGGYCYDGPFLMPWSEPGLGLRWKETVG